MDAIESGYILRPATLADAEVIAHHRASMFLDMGDISEDEANTLCAVSIPWFQESIATRQYYGWLVLCGEEVVAGGGLQIREVGPIPGCFRSGRWGHIGNIYAQPAHRRRGLARLVLHAICEWSRTSGLDQLTLNASDEGRPLYASFGFESTNDMKLVLKATMPCG
jgi:GNAT superfamily N-acetyltransferase